MLVVSSFVAASKNGEQKMLVTKRVLFYARSFGPNTVNWLDVAVYNVVVVFYLSSDSGLAWLGLAWLSSVENQATGKQLGPV